MTKALLLPVLVICIFLSELTTREVPVSWYTYIGQNLQLNCTLPARYIKKGCNASNLHFKQHRVFNNTGYTLIDEKEIHIYNSSTATLLISNVTEDHGTEHYRCYLDSCVSKEKKISCYNITVQYKPQNIVDFACYIIEEDIRKLFCNWSHPVPYKWEQNDTQITLIYKPDPYNSGSFHCPNLQWNNCSWGDYSGSPRYYFEVNVTNTRTLDVATRAFYFLINENDLPKVDVITVTETDEPDCFYVSWEYECVINSLRSELKHKGPGHSDFKIIADSLKENFYIMCNMTPYSLHNFTVSAKHKDQSGTPKELAFMTPEKAPALGPEAVNGSYLTDGCTNNLRNVTIYWNNVKSKARNGKITSYTIKHKKTYVVDSSARFFKIQMPCYSQEHVKIYANNCAGQSLAPTVLFIAPFSFEVPLKVKQSLTAELNSSMIRVSWATDKQSDLSLTYKVFLQMDTFNSTLQDQIIWFNVPEHQTFAEFNNLGKENVKNFGLTITDEISGLTSSIVWTDCIITQSYELVPDVPVFKVIPDVNSVYVSWERMPCSKNYPYKVTSIVLLLCQVDNCGVNKSAANEMKLHPTASEYTVSGLESGSEHKIAMYVEVGSIKGKETNWQTFRTKTDEQAKMLIYVLVSLACIAIIVATIYCIKLFRQGQKRAEKFRNEEHLESSSTKKLLCGNNEVNGILDTKEENMFLKQKRMQYLIVASPQPSHIKESNKPGVEEAKSLVRLPSISADYEDENLSSYHRVKNDNLELVSKSSGQETETVPQSALVKVEVAVSTTVNAEVESLKKCNEFQSLKGNYFKVDKYGCLIEEHLFRQKHHNKQSLKKINSDAESLKTDSSFTDVVAGLQKSCEPSHGNICLGLHSTDKDLVKESKKEVSVNGLLKSRFLTGNLQDNHLPEASFGESGGSHDVIYLSTLPLLVLGQQSDSAILSEAVKATVNTSDTILNQNNETKHVPGSKTSSANRSCVVSNSSGEITNYLRLGQMSDPGNDQSNS